MVDIALKRQPDSQHYSQPFVPLQCIWMKEGGMARVGWIGTERSCEGERLLVESFQSGVQMELLNGCAATWTGIATCVPFFLCVCMCAYCIVKKKEKHELICPSLSLSCNTVCCSV